MVMYRLLFTRRQRYSEWKHLLSAIWLRNAAFYSAMSSCLWRTKKNLVTLGGLKMALVPCWNTHICVTCPSSHGKNTMWSPEALAHTTHQRWRGVRGRMDQNHPIWYYWAPASGPALEHCRKLHSFQHCCKNLPSPKYPQKNPWVSIHITQDEHWAKPTNLSVEKCSWRCFQKQTKLAPIYKDKSWIWGISGRVRSI